MKWHSACVRSFFKTLRGCVSLNHMLRGGSYAHMEEGIRRGGGHVISYAFCGHVTESQSNFNL